MMQRKEEENRMEDRKGQRKKKEEEDKTDAREEKPRGETGRRGWRRKVFSHVIAISESSAPLPSNSTCPEFLNLEVMAPPTALSTSALSKTMKGAWPPSSMDTFFTVSAAIFSST